MAGEEGDIGNRFKTLSPEAPRKTLKNPKKNDTFTHKGDSHRS
jgi:hypothetical protein